MKKPIAKLMAIIGSLAVLTLALAPLACSSEEAVTDYAALAEWLEGKGTIAFVSDRDGNKEIYLMNADGTNAERVTHNPQEDAGPSLFQMDPYSNELGLIWTANGMNRSKSAKGYRNDPELYYMQVDGGEKMNITGSYGPQRECSFVSGWSSLDYDYEIGNLKYYASTKAPDVLVDLPDSDPADMAGDLAKGYYAETVVNRVAYQYTLKLNPDIRVSQWAAGSFPSLASDTVTQLTATPASNTYNDTDPTLSPNGEYLVYVSNMNAAKDGAEDNELYLMKDDGSGWANKYTTGTYTTTQITTNTYEDIQPVWNPTGDKLAWVSNSDGDMDIYVADFNVTTGELGTATNLTANTDSDTRPCWSPDGTMLAFVSSRDGNAEIYVMKADGSKQTRITVNDYSDSAPSWA